MNRAASSPAAGFTLVELLVSLVLVAVMAATISATIGRLRSIETAQQRLHETDIANAIVDAIARDLQGVVRLPLIEAGGTSSMLFRGNADGMTFSAVVPVGYKRRGLREVTYQITKSETMNQALRSTRMRRFSADERVVSDVLGLGRLSLRLNYLVRGEDSGHRWSDKFGTLNSFPRAVLVEVRSRTSQRVRSTRVIVLDHTR